MKTLRAASQQAVMPGNGQCCPEKVLNVGRKLSCHVNYFVIPAKAGTQAVPHRNASCEVGTTRLKTRGSTTTAEGRLGDRLGSRLRGNDEVGCGTPLLTGYLR